MKKLAILVCAALLAASCSQGVKETPVEQYVSTLLEQYPNYKSNDLARDAVAEAVASRAASWNGKPCDDLQGVAFKFCKVKEDNGEYGAVFAASPYAYNGSTSALVHIAVFGVVDKATAATLDGKKKYYISGVVGDWDKRDLSYDGAAIDIDFGTFFLNDLQITEAHE